MTETANKRLLYIFRVSKRRKMFFILLLAGFVCYIYGTSKNEVWYHFKNSGYSAPCVLPEIDVFDPKMMKFIWNPGKIDCEKPPVVYVDLNNKLQFNNTALDMLKENHTSVKCNVNLVKRLDDWNATDSQPLHWKQLDDTAGDFFRIKCNGLKGRLVDRYLTRVKQKRTGLNDINKEIKRGRYNVLLFGLDSLSRSAAIRQLPNTYRLLTETLGGYDFKGYTKVASATFVNMVPLLTGRFAFTDELPQIDYTKDGFDSFPFIWKDFSSEKVATLFAEDYPNLNMFNMENAGFNKPPTDHYMRPFWRAIKLSTLLYNFRSDWGRRIQQMGIKIPSTSGLCHGDRPNHVVVMDYMKQFMSAYKDKRKFLFSFLTELGHEYQNLMQLGDEDIAEFFKWLSDNSFLNDTILIVFSDHGMRFGTIRHLHVARIENRMPFLSIVLPKSLKERYPDAVKSMGINQERLTSTFDLHATLRDILKGNFIKPGQFMVKGKIRGISLFNELPKDRSCADASISEENCPCHKSTLLNITNNPLAEKLADATIRKLNAALLKHPKCAELRLKVILELRKIEQGLKHVGTTKKQSWFHKDKPGPEILNDTRHTIVFETVPGGGRFFATCDVYGNSSIKVLGGIERVNKYGNQSSCVQLHDHILKESCYCIK